RDRGGGNRSSPFARIQRGNHGATRLLRRSGCAELPSWSYPERQPTSDSPPAPADVDSAKVVPKDRVVGDGSTERGMNGSGGRGTESCRGSGDMQDFVVREPESRFVSPLGPSHPVPGRTDPGPLRGSEAVRGTAVTHEIGASRPA